MTLHDIIRAGLLAQRHPQQPEGLQHCLNCGATYEGAYCPHCGQSCEVRRINLSNATKSFVTNVIGLQAKLPRTLIDLFYRPGYLVSDYLSGKRQAYSNPFSTLLLLATLFVLINQYAPPVRHTAGLQRVQREHRPGSGHDYERPAASLPGILPESQRGHRPHL